MLSWNKVKYRRQKRSEDESLFESSNKIREFDLKRRRSEVEEVPDLDGISEVTCSEGIQS